MSGAPVAASVPVRAPRATVHAPARATPTRADSLVPLRRLFARLSNEWLPRVVWSVGRTGRPGLVGLALLVASTLFFFSTHLKVIDEVAALRADLATAQARLAAAPPRASTDVPTTLRDLPRRAAMPALLGVLLDQAVAAHLTIDTGKYDFNATKTGEVVRYRVSFPVAGPYPQVRQFIDSTLKAMPAVAITGLSLERKAIGEGIVEAQVRLTVFTRGVP